MQSNFMLAPCSHSIAPSFSRDPLNMDNLKIVCSKGNIFRKKCEDRITLQERILSIAAIIDEALHTHRINCFKRKELPYYKICVVDVPAEKASFIKQKFHEKSPLKDAGSHVGSLKSVGLILGGSETIHDVIHVEYEVHQKTLLSVLRIWTTDREFMIKEENHPFTQPKVTIHNVVNIQSLFDKISMH